MNTGDIIEITKDYTHLPGTKFQDEFKIGDRFKIIGHDPVRGFDIQNIITGKKALETGLMFHNLEFKLVNKQVKMEKNLIPLLLCDYYKLVHNKLYDPRITKLVSYYTPRSSRLPMGKNQTVIMFGLQGFIKEYLIDNFNKNFFEKDINDVLSEMKEFLDETFESDDSFLSKIRSLHELGYIPLCIRAIPEGSKAKIGCPMIELSTTHDNFPWIGEFIESMISSYIWKPMIDANVAHWYRNIVNRYYDETVDDSVPRNTAMSEFGFRGADSPESGVHSGAAWLTSFKSTATCGAIKFIEKYYNESIKGRNIGGGLRSTEHSIMCSSYALDGLDYICLDNEFYKNWNSKDIVDFSYFKTKAINFIKVYSQGYNSSGGKKKLNINKCILNFDGESYIFSGDSENIDIVKWHGAEESFIKNLITKLTPTGNISMVSDSYDYWNVVTNILPRLKSEILKRNGTLYARGDSGNPIKIVSGYVDLSDMLGIQEDNLNKGDILYKVTSEIILSGESGSDYVISVDTEDYCCVHDSKNYYRIEYNDNIDRYIVGEEISWYETKGTVEVLYDLFGGYENSKGFKVLDDHIRAIYGDSITHRRSELIYEILRLKRFASNNVSLGAGSFSFHAYEDHDTGLLYPYTRDTYGAAVKATYCEWVDEDGNVHELGFCKDPRTNDNTDVIKKSMKGCCKVSISDPDESGECHYFLDRDGLSYNESLKESSMIIVFKNGELTKETSLNEIRDRLYHGKF